LIGNRSMAPATGWVGLGAALIGGAALLAVPAYFISLPQPVDTHTHSCVT